MLVVTALLCWCMISTARAESPFPGRLAISSDGNLHDRDDICATAITIAAIAATGNSDRLAYYAYCDHDWGTDLARENLMRQSTFETAQLWGGFNLSVFYNARQQPSTAVAALVAEINKSSADDPLTILAVGADAGHWLGAESIRSGPEAIRDGCFAFALERHSCRDRGAFGRVNRNDL